MPTLILAGVVLLLAASRVGAAQPARPNILWISCEDTSPWLGFNGEKYARTPHVDRLAQRGVSYTNAFAPNPVCSPTRFAIITGAYSTSHGTHRLRSEFGIPDTVHGFPHYLRQAGYYCTNTVKTDYNTSAEPRLIAESWQESSGKAHWRGRAAGQPFFAVFNLMETHQSKVFESAPTPDIGAAARHDPARVPVPPYYPDTPAVRRALARVHDCYTAMDLRVGKILAELEQDGLAGDTIVFFWGDHGQGIPRGKRTLWDTGLKVPLVVYFPDKYREFAPAAPGGTADQLVSLMDLGPTLLSLVGLPVPAYMHGRAFLGRAAAKPVEYVFGARDRVDEVPELSRSVRDRRYLYIRNFMPDLSWNQPETFSDQLELRREITRLAAAGKLNAAQLTYAGPSKPFEALYDTEKDPWQIHNLADDPGHRAVLQRLRQALRNWQRDTRDLGLLHETEAARGATEFPLERVLDTAWRVGVPGETAEFSRRLTDPSPAVRYWAALGLRMAGQEARTARTGLQQALGDSSSSVAIEAAGILVAQEGQRGALDLLTKAVTDSDEHVSLHAIQTLQRLGGKARPALPALQAALPQTKAMFNRWGLQGAIAFLNGTEHPAFATPKSSAPKKKRAARQP